MENEIPFEDDGVEQALLSSVNKFASAPDYLDVLNDAQREAVLHQGSPLLILAGAGSGKTRVITTKIAYLISQMHVSPSSILAVTFTKKAANEMRERAGRLEESSRFAQIRTFHSFGAYFLRKYAEEAGLDKNFTVYDDDDVVTLITKACPSLTKQQASKAAHKISLAKDYCLTPDSSELWTIEEDEQFQEIYEAYEKRLRQTGNVDFGDLIMLPYLLLEGNEKIRKDMQNHYKVIMVDEYQDSNVAQFKLLKALSGVDEGSGTYVCVVGDDDQSIYKFRGAEVQNILNFQKEFPGTQLVRLETNYRSTQEILNCADSVVKNNASRLGKTLVSHRGKGKKPALVFLPNQDDETQFCADLIEQSHEKGVPYSDWAILYRTNAQSLGFETEFLHDKIPYTVVGTLKFYEREEIKDALAWISFVANFRDEVAFRRIVNKPARGVGGVTQDKIVQAFYEQDGSFDATVDGAHNGEYDPGILAGIEKVKLSKKAGEGLAEFKDLAEFFRSLVPEVPSSMVKELVDDAGKDASETEENTTPESEKKLSFFVESIVKKSGLEEFHKAQDEVAGTQRVNNLQELINSAVMYPCTMEGLVEFLDHIELDRTLENEEDDGDGDRVTLITLHNTKGLEFSRVIITGLENGIFPREDKTMDELEEERRLFYVGITRAQDELYLTSCSLRRLYGNTRFMDPSVFLNEIDEKNIRVLGKRPGKFGNSSSGNGGYNKENSALEKKWYKGLSVYHDDYGYGEVIKRETSEEGEFVISVKFETGGVKKFLPKYQSSSLIVQNNADDEY